MSAALDNVSRSLHCTPFYDKPHVSHDIGGEGSIDTGSARASGLRSMPSNRCDRGPAATRGIRRSTSPLPSKLDASKLDSAFGVKGTAKDGCTRP